MRITASIVTIGIMDSDFSPKTKQDGQNTQAHGTSTKPPHSGAPLMDIDMNVDDHPLIGNTPHQSSAKLGNKHKWWPPRMPRTRKEWLLGIGALLVIAGIGFAIYAIWFSNKATAPAKTTPKVQSVKPVPPAPIYSSLTGVPITDAAINDRPITAIMIENSPDARPQSGLDQAGVVFEAVAEGGITRFLTLYQDNEPAYVGPVRSVRPYYIQWLLGFDAAVAHVGGSGDALQLLKTAHAKDLDQFANSSAYHRISSRYAPHNMYTSIAALRTLEANKGFGKPNYTPLARNIKGVASAQPTATSIDLALSGPAFNAHYDYDAATNSYKRSEGGKPHMVVDEAGVQTQLAPKVVVALIMPKGSNGIYSTYQTIGSGPVNIFQDGSVLNGTWHKADNASQFTFTDANGQALKLDPGQTWLTAIGNSGSLSYK